MSWLGSFGLSRKAVPIENGYSFTDQCPSCLRETRFREVEMRRGILLYELPGSGDPGFRCDACGHVLVEERRRKRRPTR